MEIFSCKKYFPWGLGLEMSEKFWFCIGLTIHFVRVITFLAYPWHATNVLSGTEIRVVLWRQHIACIKKAWVSDRHHISIHGVVIPVPFSLIHLMWLYVYMKPEVWFFFRDDYHQTGVWYSGMVEATHDWHTQSHLSKVL